MVITIILVAEIAWRNWKWNGAIVALITIILLIIDIAYFGANMMKFMDGGWFPLLVGVLVFSVMATWHRGRELIWDRLRKIEQPLEKFLAALKHHPVVRVDGASIFMTRRARGTPAVLLHHLRHNKVLARRVIILNVGTRDVPAHRAGRTHRSASVESEFPAVNSELRLHDEPNVPLAIDSFARQNKEFDPAEVTYYVGRQNAVPARRPHLLPWWQRFFEFLNRNATHPVSFLHIPSQQVVELGIEVEI